MDEEIPCKEATKDSRNYEKNCCSGESRSITIQDSVDPLSFEEIRKAIQDISSTSSKTLDLSRRKIQHLTDDICQISNIEHLYLEGNALSLLSENFFHQLPNLIWLDLRNNKLRSLPPSIGSHRCLKTLLLEGNPIKQLPVELGYLTSLKALNLRYCPLEFPPQDVVHQGLKAIQSFLRSAMKEDTARQELPVQGQVTRVQQEAQAIIKDYRRMIDRSGPSRKAFSEVWKQMNLSKVPMVEKLKLTDLVKSSLSLSEEWGNEEEMKQFEKLRRQIIQEDEKDFVLSQSLPYEARSLPETLKQITYIKQEDPHRKRLSDNFRSKTSTLKGNFPELPPYELQILTKRAEDRRLAALKELKEKQALIEQRRKDKDLLMEWRRQTKLVQEKKEREHRLQCLEPAKGDQKSNKVLQKNWNILQSTHQGNNISKERPWVTAKKKIVASRGGKKMNVQVVKSAPYATDPNHYHMTDSREWIKQSVREQHEHIKRILAMKSVKEIEDARAARDRELEHRLRQHIQMMQERRKNPKGTAQEELEMAKKELDFIEKLRSEVTQRKLEQDLPMEYRFTAFTGESSPNTSARVQPRNIFSENKF